ncbi:MAG: DUF192 domain-containing protein [Melioribacteraceae bacterium]|nr:DUF192 domain-containing protein [Melioribacteraceae bacterium]
MSKNKKSKTKNLKSEKESKKSISVYLIGGIVIVILAAVFFMMSGNDNSSSPQTDYRRSNQESDLYKFKKEGELSFNSSDGEFLTSIDIEIAETLQERALGLMNRDKMDEKQGMFFIFPFEEEQSFWMRNTLISLDMIFVNSNNTIVKIHKNTKTQSDQSYPSNAPAIYVVEVIAGFTDKYNIKEGDKIVWRRF